MKYPKEVEERVNVLDKYVENTELEVFNAFHLYPKKLAYPNGYYDSRFFELVGYNFETNQKKNFGQHDELTTDGCEVEMVRIYADGSTFVRFKRSVKGIGGQAFLVVPNE